jgi:hypothetical protein
VGKFAGSELLISSSGTGVATGIGALCGTLEIGSLSPID